MTPTSSPQSSVLRPPSSVPSPTRTDTPCSARSQSPAAKSASVGPDRSRRHSSVGARSIAHRGTRPDRVCGSFQNGGCRIYCTWVRIGRCLRRQRSLRPPPRGAKAAALRSNAHARGRKHSRNLTTPATATFQPCRVYYSISRDCACLGLAGARHFGIPALQLLKKHAADLSAD